MLHLFVDISSHGFGHLAQTAPIINELIRLRPDVRLTVRCALPAEKLGTRINADFTHIAGSSDFGYVMLDAVSIDLVSTASAYRAQHANWAQRVSDEAGLLARLQPDLVLTDVAYLPLAGAALAGIPSLSMCSLNWADLFAHFFGGESWAPPIHREILAAYCSTKQFLRLTPAMPMDELPHRRVIAPVAALGQDRRSELRLQLACPPDKKLVLVAFGGFDKDLSADQWPHTRNLHWLIPQSWSVRRDDMTAFEALGWPVIDLIRSVDAVLTKPGYGTFTETACNGTPTLYLRREDWPEQEYLIDWLKNTARCREISTETVLENGKLHSTLEDLLERPGPPRPLASGASEAAAIIADHLVRQT